MKITVVTRSTRQDGSAMTICLFLVLIIGLSMGSYLMLIANQNRSVMRSMSWNSCIPALEAGVEEALTHLAHEGLANLAANGWSQQANGWYQKTRLFGDGSAFITRIEPVNPPVIVSTGISPAPLNGGVMNATSASILAAAGDSGRFVRRTVRVTTRSDALFAKGMVAEGDIDLLGNNVSSDSFDSSNPLYSTNGKYDPAKRRDKGDIATNSQLINSLDVGNANIMGRVSTGPGGSVDIGPNGTVGSKSWVSAGRKGIEPGYSAADMNVNFEPVEPPFTSGPIPPAGSVDGTNYNYVLSGGEYYVGSLTGKILVTGDNELYVSSSLSLSGQDFVFIEEGASLTLYVAAASASLGGKGVINENGRAESFFYKGLPSNTSLSFNGNAAFVGVIYAPNANFTLGGGGNNNYDFVGSSITKTVRMNGHFNFHYDENLANVGPSRGFIPISWNEMTPGYGLAMN